jgi:basic membrane protein A
MRRRRLAPWMVAVFIFGHLAACGRGETTKPPADSAAVKVPASGSKGTKVGLVFDLGGRGDGSFNDAAAAGLDRATRELGVDARTVSAGRGGENREELLRLLASEKYRLVFGVGFAFAGPIASAARDFPDTAFGIVDAPVPAPNVVSLEFASEQGAFLVGIAAARRSRTGKLGFVGGVETDASRRFEAGFVAGARRARPDAQIDVFYLTQPPDLSGFADPARAREVARGMYQRGADVVFHVAGGSGVGVFEAARELSTPATKVWAVGVDSDQYQTAAPELRPFILTSMLKRIDLAVYETISAFQKGEFRAGQMRFDLATGGVDLARSGGALDDISAELQTFRDQIIRGEITVPAQP